MDRKSRQGRLNVGRRAARDRATPAGFQPSLRDSGSSLPRVPSDESLGYSHAVLPDGRPKDGLGRGRRRKPYVTARLRAVSAVPAGLGFLLAPRFPAMNRWAILMPSSRTAKGQRTNRHRGTVRCCRPMTQWLHDSMTQSVCSGQSRRTARRLPSRGGRSARALPGKPAVAHRRNKLPSSVPPAARARGNN